jgi:hypothetical protein
MRFLDITPVYLQQQRNAEVEVGKEAGNATGVTQHPEVRLLLFHARKTPSWEDYINNSVSFY